jgi:hypothetical protein
MSGALRFREYSWSVAPHKIWKHLADFLMQIRRRFVNDSRLFHVLSNENKVGTAVMSPNE